MEEADRPEGGGAFISGSAIIMRCLASVGVVLIFWTFDGAEYKDSILGNVAIVTCIAGIVVGNILCHWARHQERHR